MVNHGLLLERSDGLFETPEERDRRYAHNQRMRFNRSFDSCFEAVMVIIGTGLGLRVPGRASLKARGLHRL